MADDNRLDQLLSSPLDQPDSFRVWWPLIAGVALGVAGALLGYVIASSDTAPSAAETTTTTTVTSPAAPSDDGSTVAYPPGYIEVADLVAVRPVTAIVYGDSVHVAFSTAVRRGFDSTQSTPFNGGRWILETTDGLAVESRGVVTSFNSPGAFSIVFPWESDEPLEPATLRLVEGFNVAGNQDEATIPFEGLPATAESVEALELAGTTLVIDAISVTEDEAMLVWSSSAGTAVDPSFTVSLVDSTGNGVAAWYGQGDFFFDPLGEQGMPEESSGTVTLPRDRNLEAPDDIPSGTELRVFTSAQSAVTFPATAEFDVSELLVVTQ
jgi:hypothetical protein